MRLTLVFLTCLEAGAEVHTEHDRRVVRISAHLHRLRGPAVAAADTG